MNTQRNAALILAALMTIAPSFADEAIDTASTETRDEDKLEISLERAKEATESAASEALVSLAEHNRLDLDIRLIGPTSVKVAGDR